jgi:hypothetical protein
MGWTTGFDSRQGIDIFFTASRPALKPTQSPIQRVPGALSSRVKRLGLDADHSHPPSSEIMNGETIPTLPSFPSWHSA